MIKTEMIENRIRHYSDEGLKIRQIETDIIYYDAVDILPCIYTYEETSEYIDIELDDTEALNIILGG